MTGKSFTYAARLEVKHDSLIPHAVNFVEDGSFLYHHHMKTEKENSLSVIDALFKEKEITLCSFLDVW